MTLKIVAFSRARDIPLRAQVEFIQFGVKLVGRVVGISHDDPMRYDLRLDDGAIISNIPETTIGTLIAMPWTAPSPDAEPPAQSAAPVSLPSPLRRIPARSRAA